MMTASSVLETEQQADEIAGADHLRDEIEGDDGERTHRRRHTDRRLAQPERHDVRERVLAEIPERLGDEEHHDRPADEKPDRVDQAIESRERHEARDAEKARGAHVVAGQREAVLQSRHAPARRVEVIGAPRAPARRRR